MATKLQPNQHTPFGTILNIYKTIPSYQRDFVWDAEDVLDFVNNLWDASLEKRSTYFCGSMVLFKNNRDIYEIVDGQQRSIVIYSLVANLISKVHGERKATFKNSYVYELDSDDNKNYRFEHRIPEVKDYLVSLGEGLATRTVDADKSNILKTLHDCNEVIMGFIDEKMKTIKEIRDFLKFVTDNTFVIHYLAQDMPDALLTYARLNTGGKQLGHLEIVKGMLYSSVEKRNEDWDIFDKEWNGFWEKLIQLRRIGGSGKPKEIIKQDKFLTYFFLTFHSEIVNDFCKVRDGFTPDSKLSDLLQSREVVEKLYSNPRVFLKKLDNCISKIIEMRAGEHNDPQINQSYIDIALLSQSQTQPLMFMLSVSHSNFLQTNLLEDVYRLIFIFTTSLTGSGTTSNVWRKLALKSRELIQTNLKETEILEKLKSEIKSYIEEYYNSHFKDYINKEDIFSDNAKLKKTLRNLEIFMRKLSGMTEKVNYSDWYYDTVHIDHMSPKNLNISNQSINKIGNSSLLNPTDNTGLQDLAFESDKKQSVYRRQDFFHARAVVSENNETFGKHKSVIDLMEKRKVFSENDIISRGQEIEKIFRDYLL